MEISKEKLQLALKVVRKAGANPYVVGGIIGAGVFAADQIFKSSIEMQDQQNFPHDPVTENGAEAEVEFEKMHNPGICGGKLRNKPLLSTVFNAVGMGMAAASLVIRRKEDKVGKAADMIVIGGAASNLYDRVKRGYVVDYLHVKKGPLSRIVFNIADAAIVAGAMTGTASRALIEVEKRREADASQKGSFPAH